MAGIVTTELAPSPPPRPVFQVAFVRSDAERQVCLPKRPLHRAAGPKRGPTGALAISMAVP